MYKIDPDTCWYDFIMDRLMKHIYDNSKAWVFTSLSYFSLDGYQEAMLYMSPKLCLSNITR